MVDFGGIGAFASGLTKGIESGTDVARTAQAIKYNQYQFEREKTRDAALAELAKGITVDPVVAREQEMAAYDANPNPLPDKPRPQAWKSLDWNGYHQKMLDLAAKTGNPDTVIAMDARVNKQQQDGFGDNMKRAIALFGDDGSGAAQALPYFERAYKYFPDGMGAKAMVAPDGKTIAVARYDERTGEPENRMTVITPEVAKNMYQNLMSSPETFMHWRVAEMDNNTRVAVAQAKQGVSLERLSFDRARTQGYLSELNARKQKIGYDIQKLQAELPSAGTLARSKALEASWNAVNAQIEAQNRGELMSAQIGQAKSSAGLSDVRSQEAKLGIPQIVPTAIARRGLIQARTKAIQQGKPPGKAAAPSTAEMADLDPTSNPTGYPGVDPGMLNDAGSQAVQLFMANKGRMTPGHAREIVTQMAKAATDPKAAADFEKNYKLYGDDKGGPTYIYTGGGFYVVPPGMLGKQNPQQSLPAGSVPAADQAGPVDELESDYPSSGDDEEE